MTTTTSPIVALAWTKARIVANAPSQAALGYPYKVKAQSLTVERANGSVESHAATATMSEVTQALREDHRTLILKAIAGAVAERMAEYVKADPKAKPEAIAEYQTKAIAEVRSAFYAEGSITFPVTARATRSATLDDSDDIASLLA
jgi:hypothetical protein